MSHYESFNSPRDVRLTAPGPGLQATFRCGRCDKPRQSLGRKLQRVLGLRTWVCKGCVK